MSGNVNVANYCNFGSNRTSNVRVNQGPGGNSSLSLAWCTDETQKPSVRSGSQNNYYQKESNTYGNQYQNTYKYDKGNNSDNQKYNPITGNPVSGYNANNYAQEVKYQEENFNQNQNRYDPGDINQYYVQQKKQQGYNQDNYDGYQNNNANSNPYSAKPPVFGKRVETKTESNYDNNKQSIKVHQTPGGRQNFQIGGDYNYFKDDGGNDKIGGYKGNSPQKSDSYQALKNNYRNMVSNEPPQQNYQQEYQQRYMANNYANNSGSSNRSSSQNIYNNDPYARNQNQNQNYGNYYQQQQQQSNQPRQPNNLQDVKFGYRVNQPPGGKSNITFG